MTATRSRFLAIERLENRELLAIVAWDGGGGNSNWNDPLNWNGDVLPGAADDVTIDVPGNVAIQHSTDSTSINSLTSQEAIVLAGGSLSIANTSVINNSLQIVGGTLTGAGTVTVTGLTTWNYGTMSGSGRTVVPGGLAINTSFGSAYLDQRQLDIPGTATYQSSSGYGTYVSGGGVINNLAGAVFDIQTDQDIFASSGGGVFNNAGTLRKSAGTGETSISISVNNSGSVDVQSGTLKLGAGGSLTIFDPQFIAVSAAATLAVAGDLTSSTRNGDMYDPLGTVRMGGGWAEVPRLLETMGADLGKDTAGFRRNFAYGRLVLDDSTYVKLVDDTDNAPGAGAEALYANGLVVPAGSTLDLNGLNVYVRAAQIDGQIVGGSVNSVADGGPILLNTPTLGRIAGAGEIDEWTFFGRAGRGVTVIFNPGATESPPAVAPSLDFGRATLLDPAGNVLAQAFSAVNGEVVRLLGVQLPADGTYRVRVQASAGQSNSTGHYMLGVWNATVDAQPLVVNQQHVGSIESPYSIDRWTFTAQANQQIRFDLVNTTSDSIHFQLTGPNGYTGFTGLTADSELITLPQAGQYVLEADAVGGLVGNYAFVVRETAQTTLTLGVDYTGTLDGSGQAQLFRVEVTEGNPLQVRLNDSTNDDRNSVYLALGAPPTRRQYDYRNDGQGADHDVLTRFAAPGTWYILVYGEAVPAASSFTLRAESAPLLLTHVTPNRYSADQTANLTISGSGFLPGAQVELVAGSQTYAAQSVSIDAFRQISATFDLTGVPQGMYDLRVTLSGGVSHTLSAAFEVLPVGVAHLETKLVLPGALGRHATATLYVEYANTGAAAMPAPILILRSADLDYSDRPRLTLDQSRLRELFWATAVDDSSHSVQIYATGASPGLLLPGETVRVPVYYAGLDTPFDFRDGKIELEIRIHQARDGGTVRWDSLKDSLRPSWLSAGAWDAVFANLVAQVGPGWGDYVRMLNENATYLGRLGLHVTDVDQLFGFELQQALGLSPVSTLASSIDASLPTPGSALEFGRSLNNSVADRYHVGPFGRGWNTPWETFAVEVRHEERTGPITIYSVLDAVIIHGRFQRRFQVDTRHPGTFFSSAGDSGRLRSLTTDGTMGGSRYELTESDGTVIRFYAFGELSGKLEYLQDVNGNRITAGYSGGPLTSLTHSSGASLAIAYNAAGLIASVSDSAGRTTTYSYDADNAHLLSATGPAGTTSYAYGAASGAAREHALASVTAPGTPTRFFDYDDRGRLIASYAAGNVDRLDFSYDETGRVTVTDVTGAASKLFFDHRGLIARREDALGSYTRFEYNDARQLIRVTNSLGQSRTYVWCGCGGLEKMTDETGRTTTFETDGPNHRPTSFTDANGNTTRYTYDAAGNVTNTTYADGSVERIAYDATGNPTSLVNRRGQAITLTYNAAGQVTKETYPGGSHADFTYDARGRLLTVTDSRGTTTFSYDTADRLARVEYPNGRWLAYTHDSAGRRTRMEDHSGFVVKYAYDAAGRLSELRDAANALIVTYTYDAAGRLSREDKGNGTYSVYAYDGAGRVTSIVHRAPDNSVNSRFDYTYDALGRRIGMATIDGVWTYTYDLTGQLTRAVFVSTNPNIPNQDLNYQYDALGNRIRTVLNGITTEYVANALNQYTSAGSTAFRYDADGNLVEESGPDGMRRHTYDSLNRLVQVVTPQGTWQYEYDSFGNRTAVVANGQRTEYLLDPTGMVDVVAEYDLSGNRTASYTHGLGLEGTADADAWRFYDTDAIGSTAGVSDTSGAYVNRYAYNPFGGTLLRNEEVRNPFDYVGAFGVMADGNGLQFMRARYLNATLGIFLSQDPLGISSGDTHLYRYVRNDSISYVDPLGQQRAGQAGGAGFCPSRTELLDNIRRFANPDGKSPSGNGSTERVTREAVETILKNIPNPTQRDRWEADQIARRLFPDKWADVPCTPPPPDGDTIGPKPEGRQGDTGDSNTAASSDPNEKFGAAGFGPQAFITAQSVIPYRVDFENLGPGSVPTPAQPATAPAQRVEITDQLSANLDWSTLEFTEAGFGDTIVTVPDNRQYHFSTIETTYNNKTFDVEIESSFDASSGKIRVVFQSIDPKTSLPPDVLTGFLPPEDGTGIGKGHIGYTVQAKAGLSSGTEIRNVALISFDGQTIIATNQIDPHDPGKGTDLAREALNTIDAGVPNSQVETLPAETFGLSFSVSWSGQDDTGGSGIHSYDIYVSGDSEPFTLWQDDTMESTATFTGQGGHTYGFFSVATDHVGHEEPMPTIADTQTRLAPNRPPTDISVSPASVPELQPVGTFVGTLATVDPDLNQTFTYSLVSGTGDTHNASFTIVGNQLQTAASFDYEAKSEYSIRVQTTDQGGLPFEKELLIAVTDVNLAPTDLKLSNTSVAENQPIGTVVGTFTTTDAEPPTGPFAYALVSGTGDANNGSFTIVGNQLKTAASFDYEAASPYSIRVQTKDQDGLPFEKEFLIAVTDVNLAPTDLNLSTVSVAENQAIRTVVGTFTTTDVEPPAGPFVYTLVSGSGDTDNGSFAIVGDQLQTAAMFDYEAKKSYSIRVRTTDQGGLPFEKEFLIAVTDVNLAPTDLNLSNTSVAENLTSGTVVGTFSTTDAEAPAEPFVYALVSGSGDADNGSFTIVGDQLQTAASFDYEAKNSYSIRVRTTDQGGLPFEKTLTIAILDAPPTLNPAAGQLNPTNQKTIHYTAVFSDPVKDFTTGDVTLIGTATGKLTAKVTPVGTDGRTYDVAVKGMKAGGTVIASIAAGVAHDAGSNANLASTASTIAYDIIKPTVTINQAASQADPTNATTVHFTAVFSEVVSGFTTADVTLKGTAPGKRVEGVQALGDGMTYDILVSGITGSGTVVATIGKGVVVDAAGNANVASKATDNTVTCDLAVPTVTISQAKKQADPTNVGPIHFSVLFSEPVTDFTAASVTLGGTAGASVAIVTPTKTDGKNYDVAVSGMAGSGTVIASLGADVVHDVAGNGNAASTSTDNTVTYDVTPPSVTINHPATQVDPTSTGPIHFTAVFSEPVKGFAAGDVTLSGTVAGKLAAKVKAVGKDARMYDVAVSGMTGTGTVIAAINAGVAVDAVGNGNLASTSDDNTVTYGLTPASAVSSLGEGEYSGVTGSSNTSRTSESFPSSLAGPPIQDSTLRRLTPAAQTNPVAGPRRESALIDRVLSRASEWQLDPSATAPTDQDWDAALGELLGQDFAWS